MRDLVLSFLNFARTVAVALGLDGLIMAIDAILNSPNLLDLFLLLAERYTSGSVMTLDASALSADETAAFQAAAIDIGQIITLIQLLMDIYGKLKK